MEITQFIVSVVLFFSILCVKFQVSCSAFSVPSFVNKKTHSSVSSSLFQVRGNVYPDGYYYVTMNIGNPPKQYFLDIDTGSDLTWLQCDAPCVNCFKAPHAPYKPNNNIVRCKDPICGSIEWPSNEQCMNPNEQCDYEVGYADHGSSLGALVKDSFPLFFTNGSRLSPRLAFGCGYDQQVSGSHPFTDGVLGLGNGKVSIVSQLRELGLTRNVVGHCFSSLGGGYLFFGDDLVPSQGLVWTPMSPTSLEKHYSSGPADLLFGGKLTGIKGLNVIFDSGSSYTYLSSSVYKATISLLTADLKGKPLQVANDDNTLPLCWKGKKPFKSVAEVKQFFKSLTISFTKARNARFEIPAEGYLVITKHGNACLGILNGSEAGLGSYNLIGDISMLDKAVIYDVEKKRLGWSLANCDKDPKS